MEFIWKNGGCGDSRVEPRDGQTTRLDPAHLDLDDVIFWDRDSGFAPFVINNTKKFIRILTFNKNEWKALLATMRVFITILFLFLRLIFVLIK